MPYKKCTKAIIATAGWGTRRMPVAKSIEKCMLPLGNRPTIDYIVQDCVRAGVTDIYFVVSGAAEQLRDYYTRNVLLEQYLSAKDKQDQLRSVKPPAGITFHYIEQDLNDSRYGNSIPIWLCRDYISEDELFFVAMGDDTTVTTGGESDVERMVSMEVPAILGVTKSEDEDMSRYGVITEGTEHEFLGIVEKPATGTEQSRMINVSKYVFPGEFMHYVSDSVSRSPSSLGEYIITDPINDFLSDGKHMTVVEARGEYLDSGTVETWVHANQWLLENAAL